MPDQRIVSAAPLEEEAQFEAGLRPRRLADFTGQRNLKENLAIAIEAARRRGEATARRPEPNQPRPELQGLPTGCPLRIARERRLRTPHTVTCHSASRTIDPFIFDVPATRSVNTMGTSTTRKPCSYFRSHARLSSRAANW